MSDFYLGKQSRERLIGVHPDIPIVLSVAITITTIDFTVIEGVRTVERQRTLVASGASQTMDSRHITGDAVDIAPWVDGTVRWDWPLFYILEEAMKKAIARTRIPLEWGGDWTSFKDGPHWQRPRT